MDHATEIIDAPSETRADSARVERQYVRLDSRETKAAFEELNSILDNLAQQVIFTIDQIIPHLAEMQSLLSQRGIARRKMLKAAGLPSWPEYGKAYADKLECSLRTIQDHITNLRRNGKSGPTKPAKDASSKRRAKPWHADAKDSRALAEAQLAINDFISAYETGADLTPAYEKYKKVAVSPTKLSTMLDAVSGGSSTRVIEAEFRRRLVPVVKRAQRYVRALEELVYSRVIANDEQMLALEKPKEEWRDILRFIGGVEAERTGRGVAIEAPPAALYEVA